MNAQKESLPKSFTYSGMILWQINQVIKFFFLPTKAFVILLSSPRLWKAVGMQLVLGWVISLLLFGFLTWTTFSWHTDLIYGWVSEFTYDFDVNIPLVGAISKLAMTAVASISAVLLIGIEAIFLSQLSESLVFSPSSTGTQILQRQMFLMYHEVELVVNMHNYSFLLSTSLSMVQICLTFLTEITSFIGFMVPPLAFSCLLITAVVSAFNFSLQSLPQLSPILAHHQDPDSERQLRSTLFAELFQTSQFWRSLRHLRWCFSPKQAPRFIAFGVGCNIFWLIPPLLLIAPSITTISIALLVVEIKRELSSEAASETNERKDF